MRTARKRLAAISAALLAAVVVAALAVAPAQAYENVEPGFSSFKVTPTETTAGGHPDVTIDFTFRIDNEIECTSNCLAGRRVSVHWPEGFIGNPHVAPTCTLTEFSTSSCPTDAQIGTFEFELGTIPIMVPMYNMETRPDQAGVLGFTAPLIPAPVFLELFGRTDSDYGLDAISTPQLRLPFNHYITTLWGVPAATANDVYRFSSPLVNSAACFLNEAGPGIKGCPPGTGSQTSSPTYAQASVPAAPFLQNPTTCGVELSFTGDIEYYGGAEGHETVPWPATTGCNQASFTPSASAKPTASSTDSASGLDATLKVPQTQSPITPAPSELKVARVTLPKGFSINPGAADGKAACPEGLSAIGTLAAAQCPEFSKIGTLMLDVAALPAPIPGALYLAEPRPGEPYRVLLTASGSATNVKLLGRVEADPVDGQVSVVFDHLPQSPLQEFDLHVFGSERGLLATPSHCGTYQVVNEFVPWNTALATRTTNSSITIDSGPDVTPCPVGARPFSPNVTAGVANNTAGRHSTFSVLIDRADGEQDMTGLTVKTPPGFAATLKGVPYCPESALTTLADPAYKGLSEISAPACPASSQVGTAVAGAGAGTHPLYVPGKVYLAGPYKGAPLSLVVVVPAVTGPYDLGNVTVRAAVHVDPVTAQVSAVSDPLPQILEGIPLRTRSILIQLDRPDFALNPTNCEAGDVVTSLSGDEGGDAEVPGHFQVANCSDLGYAPKLALKLSGGVNRLGHPAIRATFTAKPGEANTKLVQVALPKGELLDNNHLANICTRPQFAADRCPESSMLGTATATTPLLDRPLQGNVYLRANPAHRLPDVVLDLEGQIDVEVQGKVDTVDGGSLRTTFENVPDAPVSSLTLNLLGGSKGLLQNSKNLCGTVKKAKTKMVGQNNRRLTTMTKLQVACGGKAKRKRHSNSRKAG